MRLQILVPSARRYGSTVAASVRTVANSTPSNWAHRSSGAAIGRPRSGSCQVPTRPVYRTQVRGRHRESCLSVRGSRTPGERWPQPIGPAGGGRRACRRGVVVSIASWRLRNPIPRSASPVTVSTRCRSDRPNRSSFQTTRVSPGRSWSRNWVRVGRSLRAPLAVSVNPVAAGTLQGVDLEVWSVVETTLISDTSSGSHLACRAAPVQPSFTPALAPPAGGAHVHEAPRQAPTVSPSVQPVPAPAAGALAHLPHDPHPSSGERAQDGRHEQEDCQYLQQQSPDVHGCRGLSSN